MVAVAHLVERLNELASNIGMAYEERKKMVDPFLCFCLGEPVLDITNFEEWMERVYPEYKENSIENFLKDKDPEHLGEWKELFDV